MPQAIRFHLDEHVAAAIAVGLRSHGIDVTTTEEAGLAGASDSSHLAFALGDERVVVTHDHDFLRLHAAGDEHAGICYCHQEKYTAGELLQMLLLVNACYDAAAMKMRVEYL
jgi:predicted nuclease of predicted toxin-antitoxin system